MHRYLVIDGMVSGTGIRVQYENKYIEPEMLRISTDLIEKLCDWHERYKQEFYDNYADVTAVQRLDKEGADIAEAISNEVKGCKVSYFSDANLKMQKI